MLVIWQTNLNPHLNLFSTYNVNPSHDLNCKLWDLGCKIQQIFGMQEWIFEVFFQEADFSLVKGMTFYKLEMSKDEYTTLTHNKPPEQFKYEI